MPRNFSPEPQRNVIARLKKNATVEATSPLGPGVRVVYKRDEERLNERIYDGLTTEYGWYVASYEPSDEGDKAVLMPITEVP